VNAFEVGYMLGGLVAVFAVISMVLKALHGLLSRHTETRGQVERACPQCGMQQRGDPRF
jgi:hypothetical protein